jgi:transcriptional regulator with XRE-family HTH domain
MLRLREVPVNADKRGKFGKILRQRRVTIPLTLQELASVSGVSPSYLGRIEQGDRFPSARILRKIAKPLAFEENELFALAGYLSARPQVAERQGEHEVSQLDPYVAAVLSQEPVEVQRAVVAILTALKSIGRSVIQKEL